jgi:hypothetical protein
VQPPRRVQADRARRDNGLRQRLCRRTPDHDEVVAQPKHCAHQRIGIKSCDLGSPLLARFASRDLEPRHPGADIVLQLRDAGAIAATGEHIEPTTE